MTNNQFIKDNSDIFRAIAHLTELKDIKIERNWDDDFPYVGTSYSGDDGEGFYFRIPQSCHLGYDQVEDIGSIFPINIDGYQIKLHGFSDFEMDDDRYWYPSFSFGFYINGENVLNNKVLTNSNK